MQLTSHPEISSYGQARLHKQLFVGVCMYAYRGQECGRHSIISCGWVELYMY